MDSQKVFKSQVIERLRQNLQAEGGADVYLEKSFRVSEEDLLVDQNLNIMPPRMHLPGSHRDYELQNSILIYEAYKQLSPVQATDARLWTYLTHATYWDYMKSRWPIEQRPEKRTEFILEHWFLERINTTNLLRNGISLLWWVPYLTYDGTREDPYELTREAFSMLDYTRHLLPGTQGRNQKYVRALLSFVKDNEDIFSAYKQDRVRFLMRKANYVAGYKVFPILSQNEIKQIFGRYKDDLLKIRSAK